MKTRHHLKISLRQASPWLVTVLRAIDVAVVVSLIPLLVCYFDVLRGDHYPRLMLISSFVALLSFHLSGIYHPRRGNFFFQEFALIIKAWIMIMGAVLLALFAFKTAHIYSRAVLLTWFVLTPVVLFIIHAILRGILHRLRAKGKNLRFAVIVGTGEIGQALAEYLVMIPWAGIHILGFFADQQGDENVSGTKKPLLGNINELPAFLADGQTDYVYITLPMNQEPIIKNILQTCRTQGAQIFLVPDLNAFGHYNAQLETLGDLLILNFTPTLHTKRTFDILFSGTVLLVCAPLFGIIALSIKLHDRGPIFFRHKRISSTGKVFDCLKFRTMRQDSEAILHQMLEIDPHIRREWETSYKLKNDPRITPLGKWLRATSLDELPQFWNVLKGEMSVVGARPVMATELEGPYRQNSGLYCSMKPGITGPWQISERLDHENYARRISLDTWYIHNHNIWVDLWIIAKTVASIFKGRGAY